jgi:hypothetical protein
LTPRDAMTGPGFNPAAQTSQPARRNTSITITASISSTPSASGTSAFVMMILHFQSLELHGVPVSNDWKVKACVHIFSTFDSSSARTPL